MLEMMGEIQERYKEEEALRKEQELRLLRVNRILEFSEIAHLIADQGIKVSRKFKKRIEPYRLLLKGAAEDRMVGGIAKECLELIPYLIEYTDKNSPEALEKIKEIGKRITDSCNEIADVMKELKAKER